MLYSSLVIIIFGVTWCSSESGKDIYQKNLERLQKLISDKAEFDRQFTAIKKYRGGKNASNSETYSNNCTAYIDNMKIFIKNITEEYEFIVNYNLTVVQELKDHPFFEVNNYENQLHEVTASCRILKLENTLNKLVSIQNETNKIVLLDDEVVSITNLRRIIPKKRLLKSGFQDCNNEVQSIREYCQEYNLECNATILDEEYFKTQYRNTSEDLENLEDFLATHVIYRYVQPTLYVLVFVIGFTGNAILLVIFYKNRKFRKPQNMIIFNLALADTLSLVINLPLFYAFYRTGAWNGTRELAQIIMFSRYMCLGLSGFSSVALCLQRYSATLKASNYTGLILRQATPNSSTLVIGIIWAMACIFAFPHCLFEDLYWRDTFNENWEVKFAYKTYIQVIYVLELIAFAILPFIVIAFTSWLTVIRFKIRAKKLPANIPEINKSYQLKVLSRSTVIVVICPVVFAFTWLPFFFFYALRNFFYLNTNTPSDALIQTISTALLFLGCSFNPIGLYFASGNFRRYIRTMFNLGPRKSSLKYYPPAHEPNKGVITAESSTQDTKL